jgi:hypothetical protein
VILEQNPTRYSKRGSDYLISAGPDIEPITITVLEADIVIQPILPPDIRGVIIYLDGYRRYLASPSLFNALAESLESNPHYTWKTHSEVLGVKMGRTVPIIRIDTDSVLKVISQQGDKIRNSGVKEVEWGISGQDLTGVIKQLAWTLSPTAPKPLDTYTTYDLNLDADYSITNLFPVVDSSDLSINRTRLEEGLRSVGDRVSALNRDFNRIKDLFYFGKIQSQATTQWTGLSVSGDDDIGIQVVSKDTVIIGVDSPLWKRVLDTRQAGGAQSAPVSANGNTTNSNRIVI